MAANNQTSRTMSRNSLLQRAALLTVLALGGVRAQAADTTTPGELYVEPPTLIALGFEWGIDGDDNRNAKVTLEYRKRGDAQGAWARGMDLMRLQGEEVWLRGALDYTAPNMFAGSVWDLEEGTEYDIRL